MIVLAAAVVVVAAIILTTRIEPATTIDAMFDPDDPAVTALRRLSDRFAVTDELLVLVEADKHVGPDRLLGDFAQRFEAGIAASGPGLGGRIVGSVTEQGRQFATDVAIPAGLCYVDEKSFVAAIERFEAMELRRQIERSEALIATPGPAGSRLARRLLRDPLGLRDFLADGSVGAAAPEGVAERERGWRSRDGRALLIRVAGARPVGDLPFTVKFVTEMKALADRVNVDGLSVSFGGGYAIAELSARTLRRDMKTSVITAVLLLQVLFLVMYRPLASFILAFAPVGIGILCGFALFGLLGRKLTPLAAVTGGVLAGLGVDYAVHLLSESLGRSDHVEGGVGGAVRRIGPALVAACVTTVIGFAVIIGADIALLIDFALVGSLGLVMILAMTLVLLPALLTLLARPRDASSTLRIDFRPLLEALRRNRGRAPAIVLFVIVLTAALGAWVVRDGAWFRLESDLEIMHPRPNEPLETQARLARRFGVAPGLMWVMLEADDARDLVALAQSVDRRLDDVSSRRAGLSGTWGLGDLLPDPAEADDRMARLADIDVDQVINDFRSAVSDSAFDASAFEEYEGFLRTLLRPTVPDLAVLQAYPELAEQFLPRADSTDYIDGNGNGNGDGDGDGDGVLGLTTLVFDRPLQNRDARAQAVTALRDALANVPGATLTGVSVLAVDLEHTIRSRLVPMVLLAAGAVTAWLVVYLRRPMDVALCLVPVTAGLVLLLATMAITGERFHLVNLVGFALLVGIGVDHGIFLVNVRRRADGSDSIVDALAPIGHAVVLTSLTTALAFGSLAFTTIPAIQSLGRVTALGVLYVLAATLFLLTPLLLKER